MHRPHLEVARNVEHECVFLAFCPHPDPVSRVPPQSRKIPSQETTTRPGRRCPSIEEYDQQEEKNCADVQVEGTPRCKRRRGKKQSGYTRVASMLCSLREA